MTVYVAIGSAHLDVIARSASRGKELDQPGTAKIDIGGTACNIAINWARLKIRSRLLTITDGSALSSMILDHVQRHDVEVVADQAAEAGVGVFSAHLNPDGELTGAISHMPVERHRFSEDAFERALDDAHYALLDCNLSAEELSAASIECLARGIPFAVAGVSEEKALRLNSVRSMPSLVSLNAGEARYFLENVLRRNIKDPIDRIVALGEHMRCPCLMTMAAEGAIYYSGKSDPLWARPDKPAHRGNRLGAGDGFLAAFIHAMDRLGPEQSPMHALVRAMRIANIMANREHSNLGSAKPLERAFRDLGNKAFHDPLTGLANRAGARADLEKRKTTSSTHPLSVLLIDIDHFKRVNDTLGHDQGDEAIKGVSAIAKSCLRTDDIASRWGGEEFVCFLPGTHRGDALQIAERIRAGIENATLIPDWPLTVSVGVSESRPEDSLDDTIKRADQALYRAKQAGRNQIQEG